MAVESHGIKSESGADYVASGAQFVEYEEFIEAQLAKTRSHVRGVDIAAAGMVLLAGTVGYFFVAVLIDHWLVSGGLGFWGRTILLVLYLAVAGWWTITQIMPLLLRRINPLYAAQTIEHSRPTLKNALVNFLLFRSDPAAVHQRVFEQIEQQAATSLVGVEVESTVDRSRLVKIGYVLVALVALGAIYAMVSPKNPFKTVSRVFMPWADIAPPTSTVIDEIEPGSTQAFRGQQVTVKARVQGLPDGEQVLLYYTTADRQIVDRAVEMARPSGDYRHAAVLPAGDAALQQSITYRVEAGDARSRDYEITVVAAPTIVVRAVEYKYPAYTGLLAQRLEHQGDLKAIEGTEVVLEGLANQPIGQAYVDFDANGSLDLTMRADGTTARTSFRLGMSEDRKKPEYELYQLLFKNAEGKQNPQPVRHRIEVVADLAPEIQFVEPTREEIEIPLDGLAELELVASDPDFALADVRLVVLQGDKTLLDERLLNEPWRGQFVKKLRFDPQDHRLAAGEIVEYYAVAVDNKSPKPNQTETSRRRIRILSPTGRDEADQLAQKDAGDEQSDGDRTQSQPGGKGEKPRDEQTSAAEQETQSSEPGENGSPEDAAARSDREQGPADEPQGDQAGDEQDQPSDARNESGDQPGDQKSAGDRQNQTGDENEPQPPGEEQQAGDDSGTGESSDGGSQQGKQSGGKQPGSQSSGEQQEGGQQGEQPSGSDQGGAQQDASGNSGQEQGKQGRDQSGSEPSGPGQSSQQQGSDNVASDGTNDGDAIERILRHRDQQDSNPGGQAGKKSAENDPQNSKQPAGEQQEGEQQGEKSGDQSGQESAGSKQQGNQQSRQHGSSGQESGSKSQATDTAAQQEGNDTADGKQQGERQQKNKPGDAKSTSGDQADKTGSGQPSDTNKQASDQQGASDAGERSADQSGSKPAGKQQPERMPGEGQQETENSAGKKEGGKQLDTGSPEGNKGEQGATRDNNTRKDGSPQNTDTKGQGCQSKDDPTRAPDQKPQQSSEQRPDAKGGDGQQEKGESGAGKKSDDNAGSPSPQESNQPREKSQQPGSKNSEEKPEGDEQSPSTSKRESDSSGESDGDRSGGGEKGGGQKANQSGTGGAGQNTAADEGAGQSDEAGDGDTSDRAGGDRQSQNQTGQQGKQPGQGSNTKSGQGQEQAGGDQPPSEPANQPSSDNKSGGEGGGTPGGEQGGADTPKGAGNSAPDKQWQPGVDRAADPNLEYTRKATDLALEHLKDQLSDGSDDSDLLKQLGWTREEADAFLQRWEAMRGQSQATGPKGDAARRELDETLRSLGLRPRSSAIRSGGKADDRAAGLQESRRTAPPPEYSEAFKAYTQGTSRGGK